MVKTILYKRTIALGTSIDFRKDLRRSKPGGDSGGSGWRKEAVKAGGRIHNHHHHHHRLLRREAAYRNTGNTTRNKTKQEKNKRMKYAQNKHSYLASTAEEKVCQIAFLNETLCELMPYLAAIATK